jgi:hypothetical protein
MLLIRGHAGGTALTGTLYERGEDAPSFKGAPDDGSPYVWVCDGFYEVESGGQVQTIGDREVRVAFETPMPRGFDTRETAMEWAEEHLRTQFARLGVPEAEVEIEVIESEEPPERGAANGPT